MKNRQILTTGGVMPMKDVVPGKYVYAYNSKGSPMMITQVEPMVINSYVEIKTPDGRVQEMTEDEFAVLCGVPKIAYIEVGFDEDRPTITRQPDPYTAGFMIFGGDLNDERISVPEKCLNYMTAPLYKYHLAVSETKGGRAYLKWEFGEELTWKNFFEGHRFQKDSKYGIIPYGYQYSRHADRMQFIQGVFDCGHTDGQEPAVSVSHKSITMIEGIQRMLWSLNIPTIIEFIDDEYVISADTSAKNPGNFYYNEDFIRKNLHENPQMRRALEPDSVFFNDVKVITLSEPMHVIVPKLEIPGALYVDVDYMPIASC